MRIRFLAFAIALVLPLWAHAGDITYTYIDLGFNQVDLDPTVSSGVTTDGDGQFVKLRGSYSVFDWMYLVGEYNDGELDIVSSAGNRKQDTTETSLGFGFNHTFKNDIDGYLQATWDSIEIDDIDEEGLGVKVGLRTMPIEQIELTGYFSYQDVNDDVQNALGLGAQYHLSSMPISLGLDMQLGEEGGEYLFFGRYNFDHFAY